ncbi:MAG: MFS transporter [Armatimonadetes bacterium]|nr:MFS transporter [Armatimonadota bacterium]
MTTPGAAQDGELSTRENLLYSAGELGPNTVSLIVSSWVLYLYRGNADAGLPALVSAGLFGLIFLLGRLFDALVDPPLGYWSDRLHTRWGRRRPFMVASTLPLVAFFILLWSPPIPETSALNGLYLLVMLCGFFFAFTAWYGPYLAPLPELTPTARVRNSVSTNQAIFKVVGLLVASQFGTLRDALQGYGPGERSVHSFVLPALVVGGFCLVTLLLPLFGRSERPVQETAEAPAGLVRCMRDTLASGAFRKFVGGFLLSWFGLQLLLAVLPHLPIARLGVAAASNAGAASSLQMVAILAGAASFPLVKWGMDRRGRAWVFAFSMAWFALTIPLLALTDRLLEAQGVLLLVGPSIGAFLILPHALMADVCDDSARRGGQRREAMFFAVQGLIIAAGVSLAVPTADLLLSWAGNTAARSGGVVAVFWATALASLVGLAIFWGFDRSLLPPEREG